MSLKITKLGPKGSIRISYPGGKKKNHWLLVHGAMAAAKKTF